MQLRPDSVVTPDDLARGKRALVKDAAWASLVGALYGGVILVGFALELGATPFIISFVGLVVMACVLSGVLRHLGPQAETPGSGAVTGAFMWLGFVVTTMAVNNAFRGAKYQLTVLDAGHWLGVLLLQGAILGWFGS